MNVAGRVASGKRDRRGFQRVGSAAYWPEPRYWRRSLSFSENLRGVEASATLALTARARELRAAGRDIIDLCAGEPDFPTPGFVADAGIQAIRDGHTRYTPSAGIPQLRKAIAEAYGRQYDRRIDPAGIVVTAGAKQALFNATFALFGTGDRVLMPVPYWTTYPALLRIARAEAVEVRGDPARSFKVSVRDLERAADGRTRGLIFSSPCNPTSAVYARDELDEISAWAYEREIWVISDEIYDRICYVGERAPGILDLAPERLDRSVVVNGASKAFAMTGWRLGFSISTPALAERMTALQSHTTSNAAAPAQYAALAAYSASGAGARELAEMAQRFRARRDLVTTGFRSRLPGVEFVEPEGAFYLYFRVERFMKGAPGGSDVFCARALDEAGVALVPGSAFGTDAYTRLSFAASEAALREAIDRLARLLPA